MKIILASQSARRRELLTQIAVSFDVEPSDREEVATTKDPEELCTSLALQKAEDIADRHLAAGVSEETCIIGADTLVAIGSEILGKPKDRADAERMVRLLSDDTHSVYTGVAVIRLMPGTPGPASVSVFADRSDVTLAPIPEADIHAYTQTEEPYDKAGAYAAQGFFARYITRIEGDYNNVKGLPVGRLYREYLAKL